MSEEVAKVCDTLKARYGGKEGRLLDDLSTVRKAHDWFIRAYVDEPGIDRTSVTSMLRTNSAYRGLTHPMKKVVRYDPSTGSAIPDSAPRLVPAFEHRYLAEDIPYGLVVTRGIAELAGVPTPTIDAIITWSQKVTGFNFLTEAKPGGHGFSESDIPGTELRLGGNDVARSRCPQRYGWFDLDWFMRGNGYVVVETEAAGGDAAAGHLLRESHSTEGITTTSEGRPVSDAVDRRASTGAA